VTRFISPSRFLHDLMRDAGWTDTPIDVVPPATASVAPREGASEPFALFAGRLSPEKGVDVYLSAARAARIDAVVAGDGPLADSLRARYPEAQFTGHLAPSALSELLGRARLAVLPSVSLENAPLGVLEAMAAGVPVVASGVGGVPELVDDGVEGLLVAPGDPEALADAMLRLVRDPGSAERMGQAGWVRVARDFSPDAHLQRLLMTYEHAMGGAA
jgi:Glycosyltransferase